jgi:hypothetical protein
MFCYYRSPWTGERARVGPYPVRSIPWAYDGTPGEGSIPVPLPPPASPHDPPLSWGRCLSLATAGLPQYLRTDFKAFYMGLYFG